MFNCFGSAPDPPQTSSIVCFHLSLGKHNLCLLHAIISYILQLQHMNLCDYCKFSINWQGLLFIIGWVEKKWPQPKFPSSQVSPAMIQYCPWGPIAQWLEQSAHKKCAHALLKLLLRGAVSLKRMWLKRNLTRFPKGIGDNSMVVRSLAV